MSMHVNSATKFVIVGGFVSSFDEKYISLVILFRLLKLLKEHDVLKAHDLFMLYRERYQEKSNYSIIKRHIDYAIQRGLVEARGKRPRYLRITNKGNEYIYFIMSLERLLGENIG